MIVKTDCATDGSFYSTIGDGGDMAPVLRPGDSGLLNVKGAPLPAPSSQAAAHEFQHLNICLLFVTTVTLQRQ